MSFNITSSAPPAHLHSRVQHEHLMGVPILPLLQIRGSIITLLRLANIFLHHLGALQIKGEWMLWVTLTLIVQDVLAADVAVKILAGHVHVSVPLTGVTLERLLKTIVPTRALPGLVILRLVVLPLPLGGSSGTHERLFDGFIIVTRFNVSGLLINSCGAIISHEHSSIFGQNTRGNLFIIKNVFRGHDPTLEAVFELARPIFPSHQSSAESELTMTPSLSVMDGKNRCKLRDQCASEAKAGTQETPGSGDKERDTSGGESDQYFYLFTGSFHNHNHFSHNANFI